MAKSINVLDQLRSLSAINTKQQESARKAKGRLDAKLKELEELLRPLCLEAIKRYNERESYKIDPDIRFGFALDAAAFSLGIRLKTVSGHEPDETYSFEEEKEVARKLAKLLDPKLKATGIKLSLASVSVPTEYFPV